MSDKPLSEQIEQADASEFVRFAKLIAEQVMPEPCRLQKKHNWDKYIDNFSYPFEHCLARKESHIAAAIMLVKAIDWGYQIRTAAQHEIGLACDCVIWGQGEDDWFSANHDSEAMALIAALAKKVESDMPRLNSKNGE